MTQPRELPLPYLAHYSEELVMQARELIANGTLGQWLTERFPRPAVVTNDHALYDYVMALKNAHLKTAPPLSRIAFDDKISTVNRSLGLHSYVSRVQGQKLKAKNEIRVASLFKETAPEFLRMVVVHELSHLREREHNKAFYQLCRHIEPNYDQYELGLRLFLTHRDLTQSAAR